MRSYVSLENRVTLENGSASSAKSESFVIVAVKRMMRVEMVPQASAMSVFRRRKERSSAVRTSLSGIVWTLTACAMSVN